ncbi:hypothetical protein N7495_007591 [Penicillium taxi]|uniref:uncharacterized protein n=1 Tax=Penicillium taxi TaxID=168475 RepID=UPI0025450ECE|nr:uncharacterized protein N7495_007591 [Penicillium taxi]KAJ5887550.1 hypothetical protein N7495_007591 [Penicillium taxi]
MHLNRLPLILLSLYAFWISLTYSAPTVKTDSSLYEARTQLSTHQPSARDLIQREDHVLNHLVRRKLPKEIADWDLYEAWDNAVLSTPPHVFAIPANIPKGTAVKGKSNNDYKFETEEDCVIEKKYLKLGDELGHGSFGTVYKAIYTVPNTEFGGSSSISVAVKTAQTEPGNMIHGAILQKSIKSDYIVPVFDIFYVPKDNEAFAIMSKASDGDLADYAEKSKVSKKELEKLFRHVLFGVHKLHSMRIMHRDIKPNNILLFDDGSLPKIADFDMAIEADKSKQFGIGTPGFVAPEVIRLREYGTGADIFALGMTWIEILKPSRWNGDDLLSLWKDLVVPKESKSKAKSVWLSRKNVKTVLTKRLGSSTYWTEAKLNLLSKVLCEPKSRIGIVDFIKGFDAMMKGKSINLE